MKTTLNLDDQVLLSAKKRAAQEGVTLTAYVEDALKARLLESPDTVAYQYRPTIVNGVRPPNVDISDRDALYEVLDHS